MTVAEAQCRYLSPARFEDEVIVDVKDLGTRLVRFGYEMSVENGGARSREGKRRTCSWRTTCNRCGYRKSTALFSGLPHKSPTLKDQV
ncbi:MAG: hypothetical protein ACR2I2_01580 [Bryobacteraceae bacterium]